ncbi:sensor histidine kinase [Paenibacillus sp. HWE-109]|uniref:cache domain-containing sensor histidine kinase n=1 Tax=Paenibacillus sp. HWE-109 TaxID=1306526 RepID=UPI001EDE631C|nr:sensor histidine kinase [Paenibacillus sp. HWE-109]UKS27891.1 sensor histidine kinase [Paenibacillus sp. HWE-109]
MNRKRGIWYYIQNYRFQSIFVRNFMIILVLVILPLAGMSSFLYRSSHQIINGEVSQVNKSSLYRVRDILDVLFRETSMLSTQISQQMDTQLFMLDTNSANLVQGEYTKINSTISMFTLIYEYISSIYVYSEKNGYVISNKENNFYDNFADKSWYPFYEQSDSVYTKSLPRKVREVYPFVLSFVKPSYLNAKDKIGAVIINIDLEELGKLIQPADGKKDHQLFIIDENKNFIYNQDMKLLFPGKSKPAYLQALDQKLDELLNQKEPYSGIVKLDGESYILTLAKLSFNNWACLSLLPIQEYESNIRNIWNYTVLLLLLFAALGVIVAFLISVKTFQPIRNIIHLMEQLERDGMTRSPDGRDNEVRYISGNLLNSAQTKRRIEEELSHRSQLLNEAQASALQAQINPHFIGNSLETINWMAIELTDGQPNEVSDTIGTLSQLMQLSLDMDNRLVPFRVEVEHANLYLRMMDIRYKNKFRIVWDIPQALMSVQVIKLMLQPLLENAIQHGIHPNRKQGVITISGLIENDHILLHIRDNGIGIEAEKLDTLNANMQQKSMLHAEHIGLKNVNQRLKLTFGEAYGLSLISKPGEGTTVIVKLPL